MKSSPSVEINNYIKQEWQFYPELNSDTLAVARFIERYSQPGRWLDLGCGPMLTVWPLFSKLPSLVVGLDINAEVLDFHKRLQGVVFEKLPNDVAEAYIAAYRFRRDRKLGQIPSDPRRLLREVRIQSLLEPTPAWLNGFDTVIQVGCFGCMESQNALECAAANAYTYTAERGVLLSATWLPHDDYFESAVWGGHNLRRLTLSDITRIFESVGFSIEHAESAENISPNYRSRLLVVANRT